MNCVVLVGRLTRDPDVRYGQGEDDSAVARFTLAVDRPGAKGEKKADFPSCVAFGRRAEFAEKYLLKGTKICLRGRLQTGHYTNRDGIKVYTTDVIADQMEFAESKKSQQETAGSVQPAPEPDENGFMNIPDSVSEELPFN